MSRDRASLSRRQLLGSVGTVGALSGVAGAGTWALFEDSETFAASMGAGGVGVTIDCDSCEVSDGTVGFELGGLTPGDVRTERFTVTADANPIWVWLRTNCPEPVDPLGDAVEVQLSRDPDCDGPSGATPVYPPDDDSWTTLNEFRTALRGGLRLDDLDGEPCVDSELCLDLTYRLSDDATWAVDLSTELTFEVVAEQCRHVPESDMATSPFPPEDCPEPSCPDCIELGKLEVENDQLEPGVYEFDELEPAFDGDTTYALEVLRVTNKADGSEEETVCASFRLLAGESGDALAEENAPALCSVAVKGGPLTATYDVDPFSTRTYGKLCTVTEDGDSDPNELPAISNIVVWVCGDAGGGECASCPPGDGGEGERIAQATFGYTGPDGVAITFDQQQNGNSPEEDVLVTDIDDGDSFTVPLKGNGSPDFDVSVDATPLTVPAQEPKSAALHTSCSQPFEVGMQLLDADGTYTLTVESALNKDGDQLCEVSD